MAMAIAKTYPLLELDSDDYLPESDGKPMAETDLHR